MKRITVLAAITIVVSLCLAAFTSGVPTPEVNNLRCEMLADPKGIDVEKPRLSWEISSEQRNLQQVAYQVLVASSREKLEANEGDIWNSGKVTSSQSIQVPYTGVSLAARTECFWKVKIWAQNTESAWSKPAYWSMGLYFNDWRGRWIGLDRSFAWDSAESKFSRLSARYFRNEFTVTKTVKRAVVYIAGLGLYELYMNGQRMGDQVLAPVPTDYSEEIKYNTFDVTSQLTQGRNAIGTVLSNGRFFTMRQSYKPHKWHTFGYPKMMLQLEVDYADGTKDIIVSDERWKVTSDGPVRTSNEYDGEEYDATKELTGWSKAGFNDTQWLAAERVEEPGGKLHAQMTENMKVMETIKPVSIKQLSSGAYILDMGQNMAGWIRMKVSGKRGDKITLRFAETLQPTGELYVANLRDAKVTDVYTLKGGGEEIWEPSFTYHGFRYVEITGFPGTATTNNFEGRVVYDNMNTSGQLETSNTTINQIYKNAYWGIRSNYKGMPVDCPQRNERQPWLGDRATGAYGESFIFDNARLYAKWLDDIQQSQTPEGSIPDVAPNFWFYYKDNMTWPGTYLMIANTLYNQYGDLKPIAKHYSSMKQWLVYMQARYMKNYIMTKDNYGDWCVPPESPNLIHAQDPARNTDGDLIATAYSYYLMDLMQHFATLLNKPKDAQEYATTMLSIKEAFNKKFFNATTAQYSNNTVTANLLPLTFGMVPAGKEQAVFNNIVDKIVNENKSHISTGLIGTQWLMRGLTKYGRPDLAYRIASNRDYPSWGYMVDHGATTIWELWNGDTANPAMNSHNHVMLLGDLIVWLYEDVAGIKTTTVNTGFGEITMNPALVKELDYAKASYHSIHGMIRSEWKKNKNKNKFTWKITLPGNTKATVSIPARSEKDVTEQGRKLTAANGVKFLRMEGSRAIIEIGSGVYSFESVME